MALFGSFAGLAIILAAIGIYGVMTFAVSQRTREIGVRVALGASKGNIARLIVREGSILALVGLVVGLGGALFVGRAMQSMLYGVRALDLTLRGGSGDFVCHRLAGVSSPGAASGDRSGDGAAVGVTQARVSRAVSLTVLPGFWGSIHGREFYGVRQETWQGVDGASPFR